MRWDIDERNCRWQRSASGGPLGHTFATAEFGGVHHFGSLLQLHLVVVEHVGSLAGVGASGPPADPGAHPVVHRLSNAGQAGQKARPTAHGNPPECGENGTQINGAASSFYACAHGLARRAFPGCPEHKSCPLGDRSRHGPIPPHALREERVALPLVDDNPWTISLDADGS